MKISQADFARKFNRPRQWVTKLIEAGTVSKNPDGTLNLEAALNSTEAYLRSIQQSEKVQQSKSALQVKKLLITCEREQFRLDVEKKLYISTRVVEHGVERLIAQAKVVLLSLPNRIGAKFGIEAKKDSQVIIDEALKRLEADPLGENESGTDSGEKSVATPAV